jgi:hypothetical protein
MIIFLLKTGSEMRRELAHGGKPHFQWPEKNDRIVYTNPQRQLQSMDGNLKAGDRQLAYDNDEVVDMQLMKDDGGHSSDAAFEKENNHPNMQKPKGKFYFIFALSISSVKCPSPCCFVEKNLLYSVGDSEYNSNFHKFPIQTKNVSILINFKLSSD